MFEFLEMFLAEVVLSIALVCFSLMFFYKKGWKWKIFSLVFLAVVSPFYLSQRDFFFNWLIPIWLFLTPIGVFILLKNIKINAYYSVLNPTKPSKKHIEKTKKRLSSKLKMFEGLTYFLFATILICILSFSFHESLKILQFPLQLVGVIVLFAIALFYFLSDKNSPKRKLRVILITFLSSSYFAMMYLFLTDNQFATHTYLLWCTSSLQHVSWAKHRNNDFVDIPIFDFHLIFLHERFKRQSGIQNADWGVRTTNAWRWTWQTYWN